MHAPTIKALGEGGLRLGHQYAWHWCVSTFYYTSVFGNSCSITLNLSELPTGVLRRAERS